MDFLLAGLALEIPIFDLPESLEPKTWMFLGSIGPVPVYASLGLDVKLKGRAEVHSTLNFRAGSRQTMDAAFGLTYNQPDVQWVNTFNFPPPEVIPFTASINAEGSLKLSLEPALEFLVYGLAGVSAGVTPSGRIVFEVGTGQPLSGRLEADVKLDLKLAGPAFDLLSPKPELSLPLWHDEWHLFPDESAISFTQQPQSQTVPVGGSAYFSCTVAAFGTPGYQWYFNGVPMPGQTARTLLLPSVIYGHAGNYQVRVSSQGASLDSQPATLSVQGLIVSPRILAVPEGTTASINVRLNAAPPSPLAVTTTRTGSDTDLTVASGAVLNFTPANWSIPQPVVISAAEDADTQNGQATFSISAPALPSVTVTVTEVDNDTPAPSDMVTIPAGSFTMGNTFSPSEGYSDELPLHSVYVSAFYMDRYAVTKALWDEVKAWNGGNGYSYENAGLGKATTHPVQTVNWRDCVKWCNARSQQDGLTPCYYNEAGLTTVYKTGTGTPYPKWNANGYRLPTEAEWEKAARGGASGQRFPWGNTISWSQANYNAYPSGYAYDVNPTSGYHPSFQAGGYPFTSPVDYFAPNGYGLYDMAGNVWQWCWDWYDGSWYSNAAATQTDTRGPSGALGYRVFRGGYWSYDAPDARCANRDYVNPGGAGNGVGFRCVRGL